MKSLYTAFPIESQNVNSLFTIDLGDHLLLKLKVQTYKLLPDLEESRLDGRAWRMKDLTIFESIKLCWVNAA